MSNVKRDPLVWAMQHNALAQDGSLLLVIDTDVHVESGSHV